MIARFIAIFRGWLVLYNDCTFYCNIWGMIPRVRYIWFAREIYRHRKCVSMILKMRTLTQRSVVGADVVAGGELSREGSFPNPGRAQHADLVSGHSFVARVLFSLHSRKLRRRAETREQKERRLKHAADSDMRLGYRPQEQGRNRVSRRFCFVLRYHSRRFFPSGVKMHRDLVSHPTENEISFVWDFTICAENFGGGERNENFNGLICEWLLSAAYRVSRFKHREIETSWMSPEWQL